MPVTWTPWLAGGVDREAAPAAADVEHPLARLQSQLRAHELELGLLGLLERLRPSREDRAAVGQRLAEEQREEVVGDVVVVADGAGVALDAVAPAAWPQLRRRDAGRPRDAGGPRGGERESRARAAVEARRLPLGQQLQRGVEVVHVEVPRHVRAAEAELTRGAQSVGHRRGRAHVERRTAAVGGVEPRPVPELDGERALRAAPGRARRAAGRGGPAWRLGRACRLARLPLGADANDVPDQPDLLQRRRSPARRCRSGTSAARGRRRWGRRGGCCARTRPSTAAPATTRCPSDRAWRTRAGRRSGRSS